MITNPLYDPFQILTKIYSEGTHIKQAINETYIEEINRGRTVKIVYGVVENDEYLNFCIKRYAQKSPKAVVRTILKIALYMLVYMDKQKYMVTDFAVELCKKLGKKGVSGFVNAFLRRFDMEYANEGLPKGDMGFCTRNSYPLFAYTMLKKEYGKDLAEKIVVAKSGGVSVRFVNNKDKYLTKPHKETPFDNLYLFDNFSRDDGFDNGDYTFQSIGSVAICGVVDSCENLLDACSAPGGKSVLLSERCKNVTSFELHPHRVELIKQYKERMHRDNIQEMQWNSTKLNEKYVDYFDCVLCDVPCSGFGTVTENPDIKIFHKEDNFSSLNKTQEEILSTCSKYVKKGGKLYYSTCSIFSLENDNIVDKFLKNHPDFDVVKIDSPLNHLEKKYGLQFLPNMSYGAGFYVAEFVKK